MSRTLGKILLASGAVVGGYFAYKYLRGVRIRTQLAYQAEQERKKWEDYSETDPETANIIADYWRTGVGWDWVDSEVVQTESFQSQYAWSAAFISWLMRVSGAKDDFFYSATHAGYLVDAKNNRLDNRGRFKAFDIVEQKPRKGDVICRTRAASRDDLNYSNLLATDLLHCDVVTGKEDGYVTAVGGNVSNKVKQIEISVDGNGFVNEPDYFAIIKT